MWREWVKSQGSFFDFRLGWVGIAVRSSEGPVREIPLLDVEEQRGDAGDDGQDGVGDHVVHS